MIFDYSSFRCFVYAHVRKHSLVGCFPMIQTLIKNHGVGISILSHTTCWSRASSGRCWNLYFWACFFIPF